MTLAFDSIPVVDSPVRRIDPRWKLAALAVAAAVGAVLQTWPAALAGFAGALLLAGFGGLPWRWYLARLGALAPFLLLFAGLLPFLVRDEHFWWVGPVRFSVHGSELALLLVLKALTVVTLILVLLATAPLNATLEAAHALRVPAVLIHLALLTYRYIFLLASELARLRIALRVRGYRNRVRLHSYRTIGHVAGTLLVRSYERAERVGQAMACRGFDGRFRSLTTFRTSRGDVLFFIVVAGFAAGLFAWDCAARLA